MGEGSGVGGVGTEVDEARGFDDGGGVDGGRADEADFAQTRAVAAAKIFEPVVGEGESDGVGGKGTTEGEGGWVGP